MSDKRISTTPGYMGGLATGHITPSLTGAQPAPAAPSGESVEALARRMAWRYKKSTDPHHSDTYTFNRATLLDFAATLLTPRALTAIAAPAAQPADSAMLDWLEEHCTGASDSERYLPFRVYWGKKGHGKSLREIIQDAMSKERSKTHGQD